MTIGITSQKGIYARGFTYVEVLISFFMLCSGVLAFIILVTRTELMQIQSNKTLNAIFIADYMVTKLALNARNCNSNYQCFVDKIELGVFDANSSLLEGYGWSTIDGVNSAGSIGCIEYDSTLTFLTIFIFHESQSFSGSKVTNCAKQSISFLYDVRYVPSVTLIEAFQ